MAFITVKIQPGVKAVATPTLLAANIVASNLIRWRGGLPEKIGGWQNFFKSNTTISGITRALCAWADLDLVNHVAVAGTTGLKCLTPTQGGTPAIQNIQPQYATTTSGQSFATTAGSSIVTVTDTAGVFNNYSSIQIQCHVAVGGVVLFGSYPILSEATAVSYNIDAGALATATATVSAPCTAQFTSNSGTELVEVNLPNHGLSAGANFSIPLPTVIGAPPNQVTLEGFYQVEEVVDANNFYIFAQQSVPIGNAVYEGNLGGSPQILYWVTQAPLLPNAGWGVGGWGGDSNPSMDNVTPPYPTTPVTPGGWGAGVQVGQLPGLPYPPPAGTPGFGRVDTDDWTLANWGSTLISNPSDGPLFAWDPTSGLLNSQKIALAPSFVSGFFIAMPQQQIVTYGASTGQVQDPMLVAWCDNANYNVWKADVTNQAGTYRLTRGSKIIGGIQGPQQAMLWTDVGLWVMAYVGYPNVWGFNEVAQGCGLISKHAVAVYGPQVFWMSRDAFWMYANGVVQRLQCDVWDVIIKNMNNTRDNFGNYLYHKHIRGAANSGFDEVAFYFPSSASITGENDSYVKFNPVTQEWDYGLSVLQDGMLGASVVAGKPVPTPINVTAWIDNNVFGHPISSMIDLSGANSMIMQHEMTMDANGQPINWMIQTGFFMLSDGEDKVFADWMLPDFRWRRWQQTSGQPLGAPQPISAQVQVTLYTAEEPDDPQDTWISYGPFVCTNATGPVEVRCRGRYFFMQLQGNDPGSFVRLGGIKFRVAPDGRN